MEIFITLELTAGLGFLNQLSVNLEDRINNFLSTKDFGTGLNEISITLICLSPEFKKRNLMVPILRKETLQFEIELNYEEIKNASEQDAITSIATCLSKSWSVLDIANIKKSLGDFRRDQFVTEINNFLEAK